MLIRSRLYTRKAPDKDAKLFIIVSEGLKTEPRYFRYFNEINSRIRFILIPPKHDDNNSPTGLYNIACNKLCKTEKNIPEYEISPDDEVYFIIDTDKWRGAITELRKLCLSHANWMVLQSNPCFELWLYYHIKKEKPDFDGIDESKNWKQFLGDIIPGGFHATKHPIYIEEAIKNAIENFEKDGEELAICSTEVFIVAQKIFDIVKIEITEARKKAEKL